MCVFFFSFLAPMHHQVICIKLAKEVVQYSDRIMNILIEVFKNKQAVAQVMKVLESTSLRLF